MTNCALSALRNFLDSRKNSAQKSAGKKKHVEFDSTLSSPSLQKNTTVSFESSRAAAAYVNALLRLGKGTLSITTTKPDSSEVCFVSCATSVYLEPEVQQFLYALPRMLLTLPPSGS